jgi:hypothetical protein
VKFGWGGARFGTFSHTALALFFGAPILIMSGVVSEKYTAFIYASMVFAGCVMFIGFVLDAKAKSRMSRYPTTRERQ